MTDDAGSIADAIKVLRRRTSPQWAEVAVRQLGRVLCDHAHCEKKAAASALAVVNRYGEHPDLVDAMVALARQEMDHLSQVWEFMKRRGVKLGRDPGDDYAQQLRQHVRPKEPLRLLDLLLVSALIEARSCERFVLLAPSVADPELKAFYDELAQCEGGHFRLFVTLAERHYDVDVVRARLDELAEVEGAIVARLDCEPSVHG